mmetsp:Transcript_15281/g.33012  ORF Transcript_15281/g.33012 Transcript_15281/m.33012 type:complete len:129 (-) Transcript_15281:180-566(-)
MHPDGIAIDPGQLRDDEGCEQSGVMDEMFVTMCFFARLGFVQPPSCLKCAYKSSGCGSKNGNKNNNIKSTCHELVPWRRDANVQLHPDKLEGNVVFITCDTASSLVNGDAYPSIRWDAKNRCLMTSEI